MSTLQVFTSTATALGRKSRIVWRSCSSRLLSLEIKAILLNFLEAKSFAVEMPIPGPLPMTTKVWEFVDVMIDG